jgi:uncharacterized membrane protein
MTGFRLTVSTTAFAVALALGTGVTAAQEPSPSEAAGTEAGITLELNTLQPTQNGCLFTFVADNALDTSIEQASYEVVLFDGDGLVDRMTVLDFQDLPTGRTRVRQFNLPETQCEGISRVLINDVAACTGDGVTEATCIDRLRVASQSDVEFSN